MYADDLRDIANTFDVEENLRRKMEKAEDPAEKEYFRLELKALEEKNNAAMEEAFRGFI